MKSQNHLDWKKTFTFEEQKNKKKKKSGISGYWMMV